MKLIKWSSQKFVFSSAICICRVSKYNIFWWWNFLDYFLVFWTHHIFCNFWILTTQNRQKAVCPIPPSLAFCRFRSINSPRRFSTFGKQARRKLLASCAIHHNKISQNIQIECTIERKIRPKTRTLNSGVYIIRWLGVPRCAGQGSNRFGLCNRSYGRAEICLAPSSMESAPGRTRRRIRPQRPNHGRKASRTSSRPSAASPSSFGRRGGQRRRARSATTPGSPFDTRPSTSWVSLLTLTSPFTCLCLVPTLTLALTRNFNVTYQQAIVNLNHFYIHIS